MLHKPAHLIVRKLGDKATRGKLQTPKELDEDDDSLFPPR